MARYLAIFTDNINGEFDVNGFKIMTDKEASNFEELANSITWEFYYYADKDYLYYSSGEDFLTRIEFKEISKDQYDAYDKTLGGEFGVFVNEAFLQKEVLDQQEEIDEDDEEDDDFNNDY